MTPAYQEPLPGWVDNLNGPTGVMVGAGKGVIRSMLCNGELKSEVIPVDIAINGLLLIPYYFTQLKERYALKNLIQILAFFNSRYINILYNT